MKISDLQTFQNEINNFSLCLIICKDEGERKLAASQVLQSWSGNVVKMEGLSFAANLFFNEVETLPFLSKNKVVYLEGIEALSKPDLDRIRAYVEKPTTWIRLLMTAESTPSQLKLVRSIEGTGIVYHIKEEKPWEKEKRIIDWLVRETLQEGVTLASSTAEAMVKRLGQDRLFLHTELQKLICFVGGKRAITLEDLKAISSPISHETLWQLGDAIFSRKKEEALKITEALFEDGEIIFPLLANLRSQISGGIDILSLYSAGGQSAVQKAFPYLKGGFFDKKLRLFQSYGKEGLEKALVHLYQTEIVSKNSATDPRLLVEMLVIKLM